MKVFIFAIGGTGARVLRSLTYCLASGMDCVPNDTEFIPMIIDYDKSNGDKTRTIELLEDYREIRNAMLSGVKPGEKDRTFFMPAIKTLAEVGAVDGQQALAVGQGFEFRFGIRDGGSAGTFADNIDYSFMQGATALTKELLSSLYNDEPANSSMSELNLDLTVGFKGNPNIGSVIFESISSDVEFARFKSAFNPAQDRVFIISSIFGGTGSSGFPRIVDAIRYAGIAGYETAPIGASIIMPYFKVSTPAGGAINSNVFNSKQKAALTYYDTPDVRNQTLFDKLTAAYCIAEDNPTTFAYSEGKDTQKNPAHIIEMLSAVGLIQFATKDVNTLKREHCYEYGLETDPADGSINFTHLCRGDMDEYFSYMTCMGIALRYYHNHMVSGDIPANTAFYSSNGLNLANKIGAGMYDKLDKFAVGFEKWLDEMSRQATVFHPFLHTPTNHDGNAVVAQDLGDYVSGYEADAGGFFSSGSSFKDFNAYCNKKYREYGNSFNNGDYVFMSLLYDASGMCWAKYK